MPSISGVSISSPKTLNTVSPFSSTEPDPQQYRRSSEKAPMMSPLSKLSPQLKMKTWSIFVGGTISLLGKAIQAVDFGDFPPGVAYSKETVS